MDELRLGPIDWIFLLEEGLQLIFRFFICFFLDIDWVLQHLRVVHGAPAYQAAMVGERGELIFLYIAMYGLLNIEALAHFVTSIKLL